MKALASVVAIALVALEAHAQASGAPARAEGYDRLEPFLGRWTLKGMEGRFVETCAWYDGRFHLVCNTENTRADGTIGRGMSVLGYLPNEDSYTYLGIGARGRNESMRGTWREGVLEFRAEARPGFPASRVRIGPFSQGGFPIVSEELSPSGAWERKSQGAYVRTGE
jgi:hypothetical protein